MSLRSSFVDLGSKGSARCGKTTWRVPSTVQWRARSTAKSLGGPQAHASDKWAIFHKLRSPTQPDLEAHRALVDAAALERRRRYHVDEVVLRVSRLAQVIFENAQSHQRVEPTEAHIRDRLVDRRVSGIV